MKSIENFRLKDFYIFAETARVKSVRECVRTWNLRPGKISKVITAMEANIASKLVARSVQGVARTREGRDFLNLASKILEIADHLSVREKQDFARRTMITIASTSFVSTHLSSILACAVAEKIPEYGFRVLDLPPDQM